MNSSWNKDEQSFRNISLSMRGAERQPPTLLQLALRFSCIMDRQPNGGGSTEVRLRKVVQQFNGSAGLHPKHQVDREKECIIFNLIIGTTKEISCC